MRDFHEKENPMKETNRLAVIGVIAVVIVASLGAAFSRPVFTTSRRGKTAYAFVHSDGAGYATICTGDRDDSSTWMLLSASGNGIETPHVAVIADADGGQRIQFKERGGKVRTISLSRLADFLDAQATVEAVR